MNVEDQNADIRKAFVEEIDRLLSILTDVKRVQDAGFRQRPLDDGHIRGTVIDQKDRKGLFIRYLHAGSYSERDAEDYSIHAASLSIRPVAAGRRLRGLAERGRHQSAIQIKAECHPSVGTME